MREIKDDIKYVSFKESFENGTFNMNFEDTMEEIQNLHITRSTRMITTDDILKNATTVINVLRENQAYRSRCVEIKMRATRLKIKLENKIESLSNYLKVKYREDLKDIASNQSDKSTYIKNLFYYCEDVLNDFKTLVEFCNIVIDDANQTYWHYKTIIDCLKITDEAQNHVV